MALADYAALQSSVANSLGRTAGSMPQGNVTDYIAEGEAYLNRHLRLLQMENIGTLTIAQTETTEPLPTGFLEALDLRYTSDDWQLTQLSTTEFFRVQDAGEARPNYFRVSSQFEFERPADQTHTIKLAYLKGWDIATDDTNWLLSNAPDLYRYAALRFAYADIRNMAEEANAIQRVERGIKELNGLDGRTKGRVVMTTDPAIGIVGRFNINRGY